MNTGVHVIFFNYGFLRVCPVVGFLGHMVVLGASQVAVMIKNLPANAGDIRGRPLGQEDPLEEGIFLL